jgi:type II restriction enzyme
MITGNKGEWSEIYALFKLLGEGKVYAGDKNLNKIESIFYPIIKILRTEKDGNYEYSLADNVVIVTEDGTELLRKNVGDFLTQAQSLLDIMRKSKGTFEAPDIERFMEEIHCRTLKAKSQDKTDIRIVIHDSRIGMESLLGFSIKSQVGSNSTLLNAGKTTNITYKISDAEFTDTEIDEINAISTKQKIKDRVKAIEDKGGKLNFERVDDGTFRNNLIMIDTCMPQIIGEALKVYSTGISVLSEIMEDVSKTNPIGYDMTSNHSFYEHKMKNLLVASALGMVPPYPMGRTIRG